MTKTEKHHLHPALVALIIVLSAILFLGLVAYAYVASSRNYCKDYRAEQEKTQTLVDGYSAQIYNECMIDKGLNGW